MNRTQIAFALIFVVNNISLIESSVILLTYFFFFSACRNVHETLWEAGWQMSWEQRLQVSIGFARNQQTRYVCVCECTNVPGRLERRDGLWQIDVCQLANLDFTIMLRFTTQKLSASISCATHTHTNTCILSYTYFYIYIYILAAFSQAGLSYSICITETMEWAESLLTWLAKHFFGNNWLSNIHFCVFNKEKIFMI